MQNLPDKRITAVSMQFKGAEMIEEMQSVIAAYMHDHKTGPPRGNASFLICIAEAHDMIYAEAAALAESLPNSHTIIATYGRGHMVTTAQAATGGELDVVKGIKGNSGKSNGKGKAYGKRWHRGEWGHPRRECPEWLELQNGGSANVAALKGAGWQQPKGKGKNGKGEKGGQGKGWIGGGKPAGKLFGISFKYCGNDDDYEALGWDDNYDTGDNCEGYYDASNSIGNMAMMLETGGGGGARRRQTTTTLSRRTKLHRAINQRQLLQ